MKKLLYGQIGGTLNAFIGAVHRKAIAIDEMCTLAAGCFSSTHPEANKECGTHYGISDDRLYQDYRTMAQAEAARTSDRLDFVVICTPNCTHYEIAKAFMEKGFHVACEKPLCFTSDQAAELRDIAREKNLLTCVTYTYTGYNMVKLARQIISEGRIGKILDIKGEYLQDWLLDKAGDAPEKESTLSVWRMNPQYSGISNCVGDIGTHIEETVSYITGLHVRKLSAVLDNFSQELDLNANMLVEFDNGAHGTFSCSQVAAGHYNGLAIRIFGTDGAIEWEQEHPDFLKVTPKGHPTQVLTRAAHTWGHAADLNRIPSGHPEGLTMAFANIYREFAGAVAAGIPGDYPDIEDGLRGVKFIEACVASSRNGGIWVEV